MGRLFRTLMGLILVAVVAACSQQPAQTSKFKSYSGPPVTQITVQKGARKMYLLSGSTVLKTYDVGLGNQPIGAKMFEGDGRTPEGVYFVDRLNPNSRYHLSVGVSYPSPSDEDRASAYGLPPGRDIFIHGRGPDGAAAARAKVRDWTAGCIAVTDAEIEEIFAMTKPGVPIVITP